MGNLRKGDHDTFTTRNKVESKFLYENLTDMNFLMD